MCRATSFDRLEIDCQVENDGKETRAEKERKCESKCDITVLEETRRQSTFISEPNLGVDECNEENAEDTEKGDDTSAVPGVG